MISVIIIAVCIGVILLKPSQDSSAYDWWCKGPK